MRKPDCTECPLHKYRTNVVNTTAYFTDNKRPIVFFVGEAPGREEDLQGEPFVGRSGAVLRALIEKSGFKNYVISNVVACRPPENRLPKSTEIKKCSPFLFEDIEKVKPDLIVGLGLTSLKAFFPNSRYSLSQLRGRLLKWNDYPIFFTYHPAFILRNPTEMSVLDRDLHTAASIVEQPQGVSTDITIITDVSEIKNALLQAPIFSFDVETTGLNFLEDRVFLCSFSWDKNIAGIIDLRKGDFLPILQEIFSSSAKKIAHNASFDIKFLWRMGIKKISNFAGDTMLMHYLLKGVGAHGLEQLAAEYTSFGGYEEELYAFLRTKSRGEDISYNNIPDEILIPYAAKDAIVTYLSFFPMLRALHQQNQIPLFKLLTEVQQILTETEYRGVAIDRDYINQIFADYQQQIEELEIRIQSDPAVVEFVKKNGGFNSNSTKQLKSLLIDQLGLPVLEVSNKGNPRFTAETLEKYANHLPLCSYISQKRNLTHLLSTFVTGMLTRSRYDGKIYKVHTQYFLSSTATGRPSSRDPNLNNIPRDSSIKNIFVAEPGCFLLEMDQGQAEFRVWIQYSQDPQALKELSIGIDIHKLIAAASQGVNIPLDLTFEKFKELTEHVTKEQRQQAKNIVFGLMYGRSPKSVADELGISERSARKIVDLFFSRYKRAHHFLIQTVRFARENGYVRSFFGRIRYLPNINHEDPMLRSESERQAVNAPIQSGASDLTLYILRNIYRVLRQRELRARLVLTVYDSLVFNVPLEEAQETFSIVSHYSKIPPEGFNVPLLPEFKVGFRWGSLQEVKNEEELLNVLKTMRSNE